MAIIQAFEIGDDQAAKGSCKSKELKRINEGLAEIFERIDIFKRRSGKEHKKWGYFRAEGTDKY